MSLLLSFLGGAGTVTGSKYLLEDGSKRVLIDCGLFQGPRGLRQKNWRACPVPPSSVDAVLLTHGEADASGSLKRRIEAELGWSCTVPELAQRAVLI